MDGAELASSIASYAQAVSGMSTAEAAAALGAESYANNGLTEILSFPMNKVEGGQSVSVQAMYASQLWDYWKTMAAAGVSTLGAAAASVKTWASGVFFAGETTGTLAGTGGLLSASLPAVAAAAAPILGVSVGSLLYSANPTFWTKVSQALLPWAYKDTQTIGLVVDENGQVYMPKGALDALKNLFETEHVGEYPSDFNSLDYTSIGINPPVFWTEINGGEVLPDGTQIVRLGGSGPIRFFYHYNGESTSIVASATQYSRLRIYNPSTQGYYDEIECSTNAYTLDGKTVLIAYTGGQGLSRFAQLIPTSAVQNAAQQALAAWSMFFGASTVVPAYPEGLSKWNGDSVDIEHTSVRDIVSTVAGVTYPFFPIQLPIGDPTVSPDPGEQPNPIAPTPNPGIEPFVSPQTAPDQWPDPVLPDPSKKVAPQIIDDPIYIPDPNFDPTIDPSPQPDPEIEPAGKTPPPPPPPVPKGITPSIDFPTPTYPPVVPSSGSGLVHVYNPTASELIAFGNWLWVTYADPSIEKLWNNPFDGIIGAHELYATPSKNGTDTIKSGFLDSEISSTLVRVRYTTINCGSMVIPEYYGNYLDYSPYSKCFIYLPFIGIVEVDVDDIVGHSVNIVYHVDAYNGSCIAQITVAKDNYVNTVYQFSGNCAVDIPLAGGSQAAIRAGMISAASYGIGSTVNGIINGAALGAIGGVAGAALGGITGAIGSAGAGIANVVSQKSTVQHSGTFGASYGAMGIKKPYIIIRRPVQKFVNNYQRDYGFPAYIRVTIGECAGYLRVREVNVQSTLATDDEKVMIENLLKSGVYID